MQKDSRMRTLIKCIAHSKKGEFFVGVGIKILISVVIGAVLLGGTYSLAKDGIMENVETKVENLFDYNGGSPGVVQEEQNTISFSINGVGSYEVEEGATWADWIASYGISAGDNGIVWICYEGLGGVCGRNDVGKLCVDIGNGLGCNTLWLNGADVMYYDVIQECAYSVRGPS